RLSVRTPPFHGGESGSIPLGSASVFKCLLQCRCATALQYLFVVYYPARYPAPSSSTCAQCCRVGALSRPPPINDPKECTSDLCDCFVVGRPSLEPPLRRRPEDRAADSEAAHEGLFGACRERAPEIGLR